MKITLRQFKEAVLKNTSRAGFCSGSNNPRTSGSFGLLDVMDKLGLKTQFSFSYRRRAIGSLPLVNEAILEILLREPKILELLDLSLDETIEVFNMRYPNIRVYYLVRAYFNGRCILCKYERGTSRIYMGNHHKYGACSSIAGDEPLKELLTHYITKRS